MAVSFQDAMAERPGPPTNLNVTVGNGTITATWETPTNTGGLPITEYKASLIHHPHANVIYSWDRQSVGPNTLTVTYDGKLNGERYILEIRAANSDGTGEPVKKENIVPMIPPPGPPSNLSATPGDKSIKLTWDAPSSGSTVKEYIIGIRVGNTNPFTGYDSVDDSVKTYTVTNLTNGIQYQFIVMAKNDVGTSEVSNIAVATPLG